MLESKAASNQLPRVSEFYHGKSVFLTGATGFVGSVLLETLLRCCLGIKSIYILIRAKKNIEPEFRKEQIFNEKIFEKITTETPEILGKVRVISGDVSLPNLGMNEGDTLHLIEEVSIVFHCAASTHLTKPMEFLLKNNVWGLFNVIKFCRRLRKCDVLVHTSTAYSNCNHLNFPLKEEVYRLPFHAGKFLDALENEDKKKLQELVAHCKPDWPNSYTFSKCLAENVIVDTASDLPVAIIRPSIVINTWKYPIPGYMPESSGPTALILGPGKGLIKFAHADPNCIINFVPADIVANAHLLVAWSVGTKRCSFPLVVNCTASGNLELKMGEFFETITQLVQHFPLPNSYVKHTSCIIVPNKYLYYIIAAYYHYLPAIVLDWMLRVLGKESRMYSFYRFFDKLSSSLLFVWFQSFEFERHNLELLDKLVYPEERKDLTLDFSDATFLGMTLSLPRASSFYDWTMDNKSQLERQRIKNKRHMQIICIQGMFLMTCCVLIYWVFSSVFC